MRQIRVPVHWGLLYLAIKIQRSSLWTVQRPRPSLLRKLSHGRHLHDTEGCWKVKLVHSTRLIQGLATRRHLIDTARSTPESVNIVPRGSVFQLVLSLGEHKRKGVAVDKPFGGNRYSVTEFEKEIARKSR